MTSLDRRSGTFAANAAAMRAFVADLLRIGSIRKGQRSGLLRPKGGSSPSSNQAAAGVTSAAIFAASSASARARSWAT